MERKIKFINKDYNKLDIENYVKEALFKNNTPEHMKSLVKSFAKRFKNAKNPAIICVGTKKVNFDSFGPTLYDSFIKLGVSKSNIYCFHALTAKDVIPLIKKNNHDVSIAFDAELMKEANFDIMKLRYRKLPIFPGAGCGKVIDAVGDFSVTMPIGFKNDYKTIVWNDELFYNIEDIQKISDLFAKVFLDEVSTFYNFVNDVNKNLDTAKI